jgi:hypothetical protein
MREHEDLPALLRRVLLEHALEPRELSLVDRDLVRGVLGVAEDGGSQPHDQRLFGHLRHKVRGGLAMDAEEGLEVGLICGELIDALKVMVACDDLVWGSKRGEELMG